MFNLDIENIDKNSEKIDEVRNKFFPKLMEMSQIKSDIDCFHLCAGKEGNNADDFLPSKYHFVARQLRFSLQESKRMDLDIQEKMMQLEIIEHNDSSSYYYKKIMEDNIILPIQAKRLKLEIESLKLDLYGQLAKTKRFVEILDEIERKFGREITNEDFQKEQTEYYEWFIRSEIAQSVIAKQLGIDKGILDAHQKLCKNAQLDETKSINPIVEVIDLGGGEYRFGIDMASVISKGLPEKQIRELSSKEKEKLLMLRELKKTPHNPPIALK